MDTNTSTQSQIEAKEAQIIALDEQIQESKKVSKKLKEQKNEIQWEINKLLREEEKPILDEAKKEDTVRYLKELEAFKEKYSDNQLARLDILVPHYIFWITNNLSDNRKFILWTLIKAWIPMSTAEIAKEFRDPKIDASYIRATLNWDWMFFIPKDKSYKFEVFEKTQDWKIFISSKDPDFYPCLVARTSRKYARFRDKTHKWEIEIPENYRNNPVDYFIKEAS